MAEPIRIANCSGFYGDRLSAMREMLAGGPVDVLTGDYLAELTMLILGRDQLKDASTGYAKSFVRQVEDCLGEALERGVRIVSNAGGLNPAGLADRLREVAGGLGLTPRIAYVTGDDVRHLGFDGALTANAYLGGFGIAAALGEGADIVVTGRVTDASLVVGPAAAHHGWTPADLDQLAGAVVAGHVIECGTQATGGNFSGFLDLPRTAQPLGFPIAEVAADGSSVITKHDDTGGAVTEDTVTAQLLYEIQGPAYHGPDVDTALMSIELTQDGPDRVQISSVTGNAPSVELKVGINELGGYRNKVEFVLTGLATDAKATWVRDQVEAAWAASGRRPAEVDWSLGPEPTPDAATEEAGSRLLRCVVKDPDASLAGRGLTGPAVELALASYPGFALTGPPTPATPYGVFRAEYVDRGLVQQQVVHADGRVETIADAAPQRVRAAGTSFDIPGRFPAGQTRRLPLGTFVHARSGDKGGDANLGLWIGQDRPDLRERRYAWLIGLVDEFDLDPLFPEFAGLSVRVVWLPNLYGINLVIHGLLGRGVAASTRFDPQAKGLGEWARARLVDVPEELL